MRGLSIELDIPSTSWGDDIVTASAGVEIYARPLFDASEIEATEFVRNGETIARISRVPVRAILVGPTPNSRGWPEVDITPSEDREDPLLTSGIEVRMALSPWPDRSSMPVAWPAAVRQLAASLKQSVPATGSLTDDPPSIRLDQLASMVSARVEKEAPGAPQRSTGRG